MLVAYKGRPALISMNVALFIQNALVDLESVTESRLGSCFSDDLAILGRPLPFRFLFYCDYFIASE